MAHFEATAVGGYYPLPAAVIPHILRLINTGPALGHTYKVSHQHHHGTYNLFDPCAGSGEALAQLASGLFPNIGSEDLTESPLVRLYGAELEQGRAKALNATLAACTPYSFTYHADAFMLGWRGQYNKSQHMQLALLNPPYDTDPVYGRLEQRFLERITDSLEPGKGLLLYVVPHYTLDISAELLASEFKNISCFRFPDAEFPIYKQVILVAQRRSQPAHFIDPDAVARIQAWSADAACIPKLDEQTQPCIVLPPNTANEVDITIWETDDDYLRKIYLPFHHGHVGKQKPLAGLGLHPLKEILGGVYPVVMPPKPAHIALALASGLFNGYEVQPDDADSSLPPLIVKGIYTKVAKKTEERRDKDGNVTKQVFVEQPKLEVIALNLRTHAYYAMKPGTAPTGAKRLAEFNIADLLANYGKNLTLIMQHKCPPLHNPACPEGQLALPKYGFTPYPAQAQVIMANLKMLFTDKHPFTDNPFILGEVGTGKTFISLATAAALSHENFPETVAQMHALGIEGGKATTIQNVLIVCPPHLVQGWQEQAAQILPGAQIRILRRVSDVLAAAEELAGRSPHPVRLTGFMPTTGKPGNGLTLFILSREMGKLGHAWVAGSDNNNCCPRCGAPVLLKANVLVKERHLCEATTFTLLNDAAQYAQLLAHALAPALPSSLFLHKLVQGRLFKKYLITMRGRYAALKMADKAETERLRGLAANMVWTHKGANPEAPLAKTPVGQLGSWLKEKILTLCRHEHSNRRELEDFAQNTLLPFLMIFTHPERDGFIAQLVQAVFSLKQIKEDRDPYGSGEAIRGAVAAAIVMMSDPIFQQKMACWVEGRLSSPSAKQKLNDSLQKIRHEKKTGEMWTPPSYRSTYKLEYTEGQLTYSSGWEEPTYTHGSPDAALCFLKVLLEDAQYAESAQCGSPLFTAVPKPRRVPLATLIAKRYSQMVDFLIIDESHENSNGDSAQAQAAHRLEQLGSPTLHLTGTNSNGYASSMFANMWVASSHFRRAFNKDQLNLFVDTYGYRKLAQDVAYDGAKIKVGVHSDRQDSGDSLYLRKIGQAPGILPSFLFNYLLPIATAIQKEDLNANLPPLEEIAVPVTVTGDHAQAMLAQHDIMRERLVAMILSLRGTPKGAKLWGAFAQLPSYLDRANIETGNEVLADGSRRFSVRFPESEGGRVIQAAEPYASDILMPKEAWLIQKVQAELAMNNTCLVFVWNTGSGLADRVYRLLRDTIGPDVALLNPKVKAVKRQEWIQKQVIDRKKKVLICNPKAVETGLNNLTWFNRAIWLQNPNANAILFRQANGRIHRIGQKADSVKVYVPYYASTAQETMFHLLALKIQAAVQIDGVDIESALVTAGASLDDAPGLDGLSIGKALYEMMRQEDASKQVIHFTQEAQLQQLFTPAAPTITEPIFAF